METSVSDAPEVSNTVFGYISATQFHSDNIDRGSSLCQRCTQSGETKSSQPVAAICAEDWPASIPRTMVFEVLCCKHVQRAKGQSDLVFQALSLCKVHLKKKKKIQHRFVQTQHGPRLTNENNTQVLSTGMGPFQAHWLSSHPSPIWSWAPWSISQALILITWYCLSRPSPFFTLKPKRWSL